jgi:hypothetical protein
MELLEPAHLLAGFAPQLGVRVRRTSLDTAPSPFSHLVEHCCQKGARVPDGCSYRRSATHAKPEPGYQPTTFDSSLVTLVTSAPVNTWCLRLTSGAHGPILWAPFAAKTWAERRYGKETPTDVDVKIRRGSAGSITSPRCLKQQGTGRRQTDLDRKEARQWEWSAHRTGTICTGKRKSSICA